MFIQNPYGRGANVSSALSGLSQSLRGMFAQEIAERNADRANQLALKNQAIQLKQLDLEGQRQQALGQLALEKLNLQRARDGLNNRRMQRELSLKETFNQGQMDNWRAQRDIERRRLAQTAPVRAAEAGWYRSRSKTADQAMLQSQKANQPVDALTAFNIPKSMSDKWAPILKRLGVPQDMTGAQWEQFGKQNPHIQTLVAAGVFDEAVDGLIAQAEGARNPEDKARFVSMAQLALDNQKRSYVDDDLVDGYVKAAADSLKWSEDRAGDMEKLRVSVETLRQANAPERLQRKQERLDKVLRPAGVEDNSRADVPKAKITLTPAQAGRIDALFGKLKNRVKIEQIERMLSNVGVERTIKALENKAKLLK